MIQWGYGQPFQENSQENQRPWETHKYITMVIRGSANADDDADDNADANADDDVRESTCGVNQSPKTLSICQKLG